MPEKKQVEVKAAKGRPMLTWVGKRPLRHITAFPAQHVETFDPKGTAGNAAGMLFHGDNKEVLAHLLANGYRGKVNLIYIDPPFDSAADYVRKVQLRGVNGAAKVDGETYTLGEQIQYTDIWANDNYLQFMYERLLLLKELLVEDGSIYLHCDQHKHHCLRCLVDEVFGAERFCNSISRVKCNPKNMERRAFGNIHDYILFYSKADDPCWNETLLDFEDEEVATVFPRVDKDGRRYTTTPLHAPGERTGITGQPWKGIPPPPGRHWRMVPSELDRLETAGLIEWSDQNVPRRIIYADESGGKRIQDIWYLKDPMYPIYPTEKNEEMVERIIRASSNPGDLVLDCFIGSGTTAAVAQKLGRRWIGCDINKGAIQTTCKRLQAIVLEQIAEEKKHSKRGKQGNLPAMEDAHGAETPRPAQLAFALYRVNDYDLQIQHNEAVNMACEHIGVTRTRADSYFDGTVGKKLVKIVPFGRPLTPLDLEELKRELDARRDEERDVVVVCLGKELATDAWVDEWNRLRRKTLPIEKGGVPNRVEVIELRTDPKYGKFFEHKPAIAKVVIKRVKGKLAVEIEDFISPTVIERLQQQAGILQPKITDWRAMVDSVMIDAAYDGKVFNISLSDVPAKKADLVEGKYELPAPPGKTTVAVKITDMLGEEVLTTRAV